MTSFEMLVKVLEEIYMSQLEMIDLAKHKKQILITGEVVELSRIIQLEVSWIKNLSKLEEERIAITQQLLKEKNIAMDKNVTMSQLLDIINSPREKQLLIDINDKLAKTFEDIQDLNDLNTDLINQSLDYLTNTLDSITQDNKQSYTYSKPNIQQNTITSTRGLFDKKA